MERSQIELDAARRGFETDLQNLRSNLATKAGLQPRRSGWWVLLLAGALGIALGAGHRVSSGRRRRGDLGDAS